VASSEWLRKPLHSSFRRTLDRGPGQAPESSVVVALRYSPLLFGSSRFLDSWLCFNSTNSMNSINPTNPTDSRLWTVSSPITVFRLSTPDSRLQTLDWFYVTHHDLKVCVLGIPLTTRITKPSCGQRRSRRFCRRFLNTEQYCKHYTSDLSFVAIHRLPA